MAATRDVVLVVEDDYDVRESLVDVLETEGFEARDAADGEEALAHLREGLRPGVIVLDLMMAGMNGWQFLDAQRADPALAGIPVVVVSAYASPEAVRALGASDYLPKPVEIDRLLAVVQRYCRPAAS